MVRLRVVRPIYYLGAFMPVAVALKLAEASAPVVFFCSALAVIPATRLKEFPRPPAGARVYPWSKFLVGYLVAFAVWHLATGLFNPLNNVYFKRLGFTDRQIGSTFAVSQAFQAVAMLFSPVVVRRFGLLNGIVLMMAATAFGLGALAAQPAGAAAAAYIF